MRKRSGEVYNFKWEELGPIRVKPPRTISKNCAKCSKDLTPEDRSSFFFMYPGNDYDKPSHFISLYQASKVTGISICALRNACNKANLTITRQSGGFVEKFEVYWASTCFDCCPKTKKELLWELAFSLNFQGILYYINFTLFLKDLIYIEERNPRKRGLKIGIFGIRRYLGSQFWVQTGNPIPKFRLFSLNFQDILYYIIFSLNFQDILYYIIYIIF